MTIIELVQHPDFVIGKKWAREELWTGYILADLELVEPETE